MPIQIADPQVIAKIERLSRMTGLGKTATVEAAVDRMLAEAAPASSSDPWAGIDGIIAQLHRIPPRPDAFEAVEYDDAGLPRGTTSHRPTSFPPPQFSE
jgi:antitoxin VapB